VVTAAAPTGNARRIDPSAPPLTSDGSVYGFWGSDRRFTALGIAHLRRKHGSCEDGVSPGQPAAGNAPSLRGRCRPPRRSLTRTSLVRRSLESSALPLQQMIPAGRAWW